MVRSKKVACGYDDERERKRERRRDGGEGGIKTQRGLPIRRQTLGRETRSCKSRGLLSLSLPSFLSRENYFFREAYQIAEFFRSFFDLQHVLIFFSFLYFSFFLLLSSSSLSPTRPSFSSSRRISENESYRKLRIKYGR